MSHRVPHRNVTVPMPRADVRLLEQFAAEQRMSKAELLRRQLAPLLELLRQLRSQAEDE